MTNKNTEKNFQELFYGLEKPSAYAGPQVFVRQTKKKKISDKDALTWLCEQDAYNLHKRLRKNFQRRSYNVTNINDLWEIDLMDLKSLKHNNNNHTFVLVAIDVFSKYAYAEPMKSKSGDDASKAFSAILRRTNGCLPITVQSDRGREFVNKNFRTLLEKKNINFRLVRDPDVKAACVERFIRTLKTRLWRYFTHQGTTRYVDVLQKFVDSYNMTVHSSIGVEPACVTLYNANTVRKHLRDDRKVRKPRYKIGTFVRVSRAPNVFRKGYERGWSNELFKIVRISTTRPPPIYFLDDLTGEAIDGFYYGEELSAVKKTELFEIEKIVRTKKGKNGEKTCLVRWKGYSSKHDSWIPASEIQNITK